MRNKYVESIKTDKGSLLTGNGMSGSILLIKDPICVLLETSLYFQQLISLSFGTTLIMTHAGKIMR